MYSGHALPGAGRCFIFGPVINALISDAAFTVITAAGCEVSSNGNIGCGGIGTVSFDSTFSTDADGKITITGLNPGSDVLTETKVPGGYFFDNPRKTIVFVTGFPQYAAETIQLYPSGYVMKQAMPEKIAESWTICAIPSYGLCRSGFGCKSSAF